MAEDIRQKRLNTEARAGRVSRETVLDALQVCCHVVLVPSDGYVRRDYKAIKIALIL